MLNCSRSLTPGERAAIIHRKRVADSAQMSFADWAEPDDMEEDLLQRDFRRALKARVMTFNVPVQIATTALLLDHDANQDPATRAWNSSVALFYKAGGLPWRVKFEGPETCFIGISFHFVKRLGKPRILKPRPSILHRRRWLCTARRGCVACSGTP